MESDALYFYYRNSACYHKPATNVLHTYTQTKTHLRTPGLNSMRHSRKTAAHATFMLPSQSILGDPQGFCWDTLTKQTHKT